MYELQYKKEHIYLERIQNNIIELMLIDVIKPTTTPVDTTYTFPWWRITDPPFQVPVQHIYTITSTDRTPEILAKLDLIMLRLERLENKHERRKSKK